MLSEITPIVLTYNESPNIERCLSALTWAKRVLVVDSFSDDDTVALCAKFPNTELIQNAFESFSQQANYALEHLRTDKWVLSMDADYIVSDSLVDEIAGLQPPLEVSGFRIGFRYVINGKALRGSLYPARICLYRPSRGQYLQDGHAHKLELDGNILELNSRIYHDDRKSETRWLASQKKYALQEAVKLNAHPWQKLSAPDKLRRLGLGPLLVLPYTLIFKGLFLDGRAGFEYVRQRFVAERILHKALKNNSKTAHG